jgi:flagellar hook-associated protein 2
MQSAASVGGLISGIDTNSILEQLYNLACAPIRRLEARQLGLHEQSGAWSQIEARLISFRSLASQLAAPAAFDAHTATSSRADLVTASASSSAVPGTYVFTVNALAQTHQVKSQGYADTDQTEVGTGTLTITVGDGDPTVIDVDNFTLAELRDAINAADAGVGAAIVNDGGDTTPYRLILTSKTGGLDGEMTADVSLTGGTPPTFTDLQAAQDAEIQLGSGAGAITISSGSNTIADAIQGVTLYLIEADPTAPVTLTVAADTAAINGLITDFVAAYNEVIYFFGDQFYYDPDTGQAGTLFGNYQLQSLQRDFAAAASYEVIGISSPPRALADIGIRTLSNGALSIDWATLAGALASQLDDVRNVFAAVGEASENEVAYLSYTSDTRPSGVDGYAVDITQVARQARVTAGVAQTVALTGDETLTIQGVAIQLTAGMTQSDVITTINSYQEQTGLAASATDADGEGTGNYLTLTRVAYGSAYHLEGVSSLSNQGGGDTSGLGNVTVTDENPAGESGSGTGATGLDVEGTIDGESASGAGQRLTAEDGDPEGLAILVTATAPGSYGVVYFTVGAAESAFRVAAQATDTFDGTITAAQQYITDTIDDIDQEIARLQTLIEQEQERLRASFARMEQALGQFQIQSQFLASQIAQMSANASAMNS